MRAKKHAIRQIAVIEVAGRLSEPVQDLDRAIQLALAEGPRGVVCDLTSAPEGAGPAAVEVLAMAGRHVRDWPGIPVAVACPDRNVREALVAHPLGNQLIVTESMFSAIAAVSATPDLAVQWLRLAPHPTAPRASREFVTRTLLDWGLGRLIRFASLVVSELVASSTIHAGTNVELSVTWDRGALRLTVRDHGPALPDQQPSGLDLHGRRRRQGRLGRARSPPASHFDQQPDGQLQTRARQERPHPQGRLSRAGQSCRGAWTALVARCRPLRRRLVALPQ